MKALANIVAILGALGVVVTTVAFAGGYESFAPAIVQNLLFGFTAGYSFLKSDFVA